jgi:HAE1 family hydrophobic/amphiphilic exporter-1
VAALVRAVPGTANVSDGGATGQPEMVVNIDRRRAADLGLTPGQVASVLRTGIAGSQIGTYRPEGTKGWDVTVLLDQAERARPEQVADIPIVTPRGATIKLGQVANITTVSGPTQVDRYNRKRSVAVTAYLDGRTSGDVARDIEAAIADVQVPAGYIVAQGGEAQDQGEAFAEIFTALGLSVVLMYLLMVVLFGSVLYPLIIMLSLPLAIVGAFGLLAATGNTLNIMSMIGLILLMGLVGKNAILLVDYTNHLRRRGVPRNEALLEAGPTRLRPILMTTSALILAMLPLAMRLGEGSEWRAPTAVTVIGGLLTSTLLTLILIPAVYTIMDDMQSGLIRAYRWVSGRFSKSEPDDGEPEPAQEPAPRPAPRPRPAPVPVAGGSE